MGFNIKNNYGPNIEVNAGGKAPQTVATESAINILSMSGTSSCLALGSAIPIL